MQLEFELGVGAIVAFCLIAFVSSKKEYYTSLSGFFLGNRELTRKDFVVVILLANLSVGNFLIFAAVWGYIFGVGGLIWFCINLALNVGIYRLYKPSFAKYTTNKKNSGTVHEFLSIEFGQTEKWGKRIRSVAALTTIAGLLFAIVFELHVTASILANFLKIDVVLLFVILSVVICIYSAMGGFHSLILTDYVNAFVMILGLGAIGWILYDVYWFTYPVTVGAHAAFAPPPAILPKSLRQSFLIGWPNAVSICAVGSGWFLVAMDQWQRTCALEEPDSVKGGMWTYLGITAFFAAVFSMVGILDRAQISTHLPGSLSKSVNSLIGANPLADLFLAHMTTPAPEWAFVIFAVSLFAAALSTSNTFLVVCGHSFASDVLALNTKGGSIPALSDDQEFAFLSLARNAIVGMGGLIIGTWITLYVLGFLRAPLQFFFIAYSIQFALLAPILCVRLPDRFKPGERAVFWSVSAGAFFSIAWGLYWWQAAKQAVGLANHYLVLTPVATCTCGLAVIALYKPVSIVAKWLPRKLGQ